MKNMTKAILVIVAIIAAIGIISSSVSTQVLAAELPTNDGTCTAHFAPAVHGDIKDYRDSFCKSHG